MSDAPFSPATDYTAFLHAALAFCQAEHEWRQEQWSAGDLEVETAAQHPLWQRRAATLEELKRAWEDVR